MTNEKAKDHANQIIESARRRAPSFVLLNHIASLELDALELSPVDRELVVSEARYILHNER